MRIHRRFVAVALAVGTMALATNAHAWTEVELNGPGLAHGEATARKVMTKAELRACVMRRDGLNDAVARLRDEDAAWSAEAARIRSLKDEIALQAPMVDRYDPASVDRYNALVEQAAKRTMAHNEGMKELGAKYYEHKRLRTIFDRQCGARYYEADLQALRTGFP